MGMTCLILLHGLERFVDEVFGLLVKLGWFTAILITILIIKQITKSFRSITEKLTLISVTLLSFLIVSVICLLLLPTSHLATTTQFDVRSLLGLGSSILWLTIALDILAISKARKSHLEMSIGNMMLVLFVPIIGAGYYLISNKAKEKRA